jgi:RND family efflux transporter MFP subunit
VKRLPPLLALLVAGCGGASGSTSAAKQPGPPPIQVRVAPVVARDVVYDIKALGSLEADELVQVTAQVEGAVMLVRFSAGDHVTTDSVIARIDPDRYRLEAQRAEGAYKKALADQHRAEADLVRREALAQEQLVAAEELNRSRQETERLSADAAAAKATWDWAQENQRRADVKPSRAGVVNTKSVQTGQYVKEGDVLATIVDTSRIRLRFKVSDAESLRAREGENVSFRVGALGERDFPARIYHVSDVADPTTRQVEVLAWVKNPGVLKPGFFAEVTLATESRKAALVIPEGAVQASERGFVTYAVEQGKARIRPIQIGLRTGTGVVEIVSGLKVGEIVVTEGSDRIADGAPVEAVAGGASPAPAPLATAAR